MVRKIIWLLVILIVFTSQAVFACSCATPQSVEIAFSQSQAVFVGTVIKMEPSKNHPESTKDVTFEVIKPYKGVSGGTIVVQTALYGVSCGFPFEEAKQYLVYATDYGGMLYVSSCSLTNELRYADDDLQILGRLFTH